jgi:hypothetical protein
MVDIQRCCAQTGCGTAEEDAMWRAMLALMLLAP